MIFSQNLDMHVLPLEWVSIHSFSKSGTSACEGGREDNSFVHWPILKCSVA